MRKKTQDEFIHEISVINPCITVIGTYINTNTKILCECNKCGHKWMVRPYSLIAGTGCPKCAGIIKKTQEDFVTELHEIAPEIQVVGTYSGWDQKIKARCLICGNEWIAAAGKLLSGRGCPNCNFRHHTSFPEQAVFYYVSKIFADAISSYSEKGYELDIYIPSIRVAIEYDGFLWHKSRIALDNDKDEKCIRDNITLIRIRERGLAKTNTATNIMRKDNNSVEDLDKCIISIFNIIGVAGIVIDTKKDRQKILSTYIKGKTNNSVLTTHPELALEWDMQNNHGLLPEMFSSGSSEPISWICHICGHRWIANISDRANGNGCPACSKRVATPGTNDIVTLFPLIASEWDYEKNNGLLPEKMLPGSSKVVWWKCRKCNAEWKASIENRCKKNGTGCPYCYGRAAVHGKNDLKTINPILAAQWHPTKNGALVPETILPNSNKKVWWKCNHCGYEWQAVVSNRNKGCGCPHCAQKKRAMAFNTHVTKDGKNTLETSNPTLAKEWHPTKNGELLPRNVAPRSGKKVWWQCRVCGFEWQASIYNRNKIGGTGCPVCAGKLKATLPSSNDIHGG